MKKLGSFDPAKDENYSVLRPFGVWAVISPFNFPMALAVNPAAAAYINRLSDLLFVLALLIHFILLSTAKSNWIEGDSISGAAVAEHMDALPETRS